MPKTFIRFIFIILIMLNHAVSACESLVMHLPDEHHPFSMLDSNSHQPDSHHELSEQRPSLLHAQNAADPTSDLDEHHPSHAHVSCHISSSQLVHADPVVHRATTPLQYALITTSYAPAVPPPNR